MDQSEVNGVSSDSECKTVAAGVDQSEVNGVSSDSECEMSAAGVDQSEVNGNGWSLNVKWVESV